MKTGTKIVAIAAMLVAGMAFAEEQAKDPNVIAWKDLMHKNGAAAKVLGDMASGKTAFDAAAAGAAKDTLIADSKDIATVFKTPSDDPASEAKPDVWTNWDDFVAKAADLTKAAEGIDTSSAASIGAGMGAIGGACKACHSAYRT